MDPSHVVALACPYCFQFVYDSIEYDAHVQRCHLYIPKADDDEMKRWTVHDWALYNQGMKDSKHLRLDGGVAGGVAGGVRQVTPPRKKQTLKLGVAGGVRQATPPRKKQTLKLGEAGADAAHHAAGVETGAAGLGAAQAAAGAAGLGTAQAAAGAAGLGAAQAAAGAAGADRAARIAFIDKHNAQKRVSIQFMLNRDPDVIEATFRPMPYDEWDKPAMEFFKKQGGGGK